MNIELTNCPKINAVQTLDLEGYIVVLVPCNEILSKQLSDGGSIPALDGFGVDGLIRKMIKKGDFNGQVGQSISVRVVNKSDEIVIFSFFGTDSEEENIDFSNEARYFRAGGLAKGLVSSDCSKAAFLSPKIKNKAIFAEADLLNMANGIVDASYSFSKYITEESRLKKMNNFKELDIDESISQDKIDECNILNASNRLARDLVNYAPNNLFPESYANFIENTFKGDSNVEVKIYNPEELKKIGMHMLLGVGQASDNSSRVAILKYKGDKENNKYETALVGKGVTFDSGGLSLKPANYMMDMKTDMGGSAAVVGAIKAISQSGLKANIIGAVGLVENSINGNAQRPGDVVKSLSGKTVEVLNTDAEGRLVLGDVITFVQQEFKVDKVINLATLTGAIGVALGDFYAGLFSNNDSLANAIIESGKKTGEKSHRLPMGSEYSKMIKSTIADIKNISNTGLAGSITAAEFLKCFVEKETEWAHIDIAGTAYLDKPYPSSHKIHATGFGVRLLYDLIKSKRQSIPS